MNKQTIGEILTDWHNGMSHSAILAKYNISRQHEFAITECGKNLTVDEIHDRLEKIEPGMNAKEIQAIMVH